MKKERIAQIGLVICMYLPYIVFFMNVIITNIYKIENRNLLLVALIIELFLIVISFLVGVLNVAIAIVNAFGTKRVVSLTKQTFLVKLFLIPWYILNLLSWILIIAGFLNPWMMIAIPIVIPLGITLTYMFLLFTNVHNFSFVIKLVKDKKLKLTSDVVIPVLLHFFFVLDILGSYLLHKNLNKIFSESIKCEFVEL